MTGTYKETVLRYRVFKHDDLPEAHKEAYRARGIDPDELWQLVASFPDVEGAVKFKEWNESRGVTWETWKIEDGGKEEVIERPVW